ncbi:MAG: hypothetical protein IH943_10810 [Acidobacteria bacterium]|nr:hypothetical protein [Acidobacteriota bacterium]
MPDNEDFAEYWRRLRALESIRLASENLPPMGAGFFPEPGSGWNLNIVEQLDTDEKSNWYVSDLGMQMLDEPDVVAFDEGIEQIGLMQSDRSDMGRRSQWKGVLSLTLFLPLMLILSILRFPSRPGSPYTVGQVVLGFGSFVAIVGFVFGLFQRNWLMVGISAYWWIGSKVIESEARARGHIF